MLSSFCLRTKVVPRGKSLGPLLRSRVFFRSYSLTASRSTPLEQIFLLFTGLVYTFTNLQVRVWSGKKKLSTTIRTVVQPVQDPALSQIPIDSTDKETEETLQVSDVHSVQKIEKYLKCKHCNKKILQGTCTDVIQCKRWGFIMRATTCEKSVTAKMSNRCL